MRLRGRERVSTAVSGWLPQGAPYVFSPADLTPALWLDASDTSTITESSGSVSQWASKAGGYNAVQATGANQPTTGTETINGLNVIDFDGTNDRLTVASFDMTGGQQFSIAAVFTASSGTTQAVVEHTAILDSNPGAFGVFKESDDTVALAKRGTSLTLSIFDTTSTLTTTPKVYVGTHDGTLSTDETNGWLNNSNSGTRPFNANTNSNNLNATLFIGARGGTSLFLDGSIAELVITKTVLSTNEREALQTYLADKWGITF
jgi:hypothetical protein